MRACRWPSSTHALMHARIHTYIHTSRPRTIYAEFDSGTSHIRTRVNQRIGTLDSSTHITSQSARRHLKISFGQVSAAAPRVTSRRRRSPSGLCLAKPIAGFLLIRHSLYRSISHPSCVPRINYAPPPERYSAKKQLH